MEKIAVLLATYNGEKYLEPQIKSIMNQSYKNFICYVHDDGSKDNTKKILEKYKKDYFDKFVILDGPSQHGSRDNFFYLLKNVEADYYFFADQDDYWYENKIEIMIQAIKEKEQNNRPIYAFCDLEVVNDNLELIADSYMHYTGRAKKIFSPEYLFHRNYAPGCASVINKELRNLMICNKNIYSQTEMHDWWGMLIASCFGEIYYVNKSLIKYRQHGNNVLGAQKYISLEKLKKVVNKKKEINNLLEKARLNANLLLKLGKSKGLDTKIPEEYLEIIKKNKLQRAIYYKKINLPPIATFWMIIFG